jgi:hypothetical protein
MYYYLTFGLGFFVAAFLINIKTLKDAPIKNKFFYLLMCIFLWPIGVGVLLSPREEDIE